MALDLSTDWQLIDDPVTVAVSRKPEEGQPAVSIGTIDYVQRGAIDRADIAANASWLLKDTAVFHLWLSRCPANFSPRLGDKVTDATGVWVVESVGFMDRDAGGVQRVRLVCTRSKA